MLGEVLARLIMESSTHSAATAPCPPLPRDVWGLIFALLPVYVLRFRVSLVCKNFRKQIVSCRTR